MKLSDKVYAALDNMPAGATAEQLAKKLKRNRQAIYRALRYLTSKALIAPSHRAGTKSLGPKPMVYRA